LRRWFGSIGESHGRATKSIRPVSLLKFAGVRVGDCLQCHRDLLLAGNFHVEAEIHIAAGGQRHLNRLIKVNLRGHF